MFLYRFSQAAPSRFIAINKEIKGMNRAEFMKK